MTNPLVEQVAAELQRMIQRGKATYGAPERNLEAGWLQCLACDRHGHCAVRCSDGVSSLIAAGAERVGAQPGIGEVPRNLAGYLDHTLLKPDATEDQLRYLCAEAAKYRFKSVCVNPFWVSYCRDLLRGHPVLVCTVIGFPLGANAAATKAAEAARAVGDGAEEVDMVINIGALKSGMDRAVEDDIRGVVQAAGKDVVVKVILETALLNDEEKIRGCKLSKAAGADFVKTSTGFGPGGATAADIALMRRVVGPSMGVKASGGVRDTATAKRMIQSGATRIGASSSVRIVDPPIGGGNGGGSGY